MNTLMVFRKVDGPKMGAILNITEWLYRSLIDRMSRRSVS